MPICIYSREREKEKEARILASEQVPIQIQYHRV